MSTNEVRKIEVKEAKKVRNFSMPIGLNIIFLALGICLIIWADKVTSLISICLGSLFIIYALYNFIAWYRVENRGLSDSTKLIVAIALAIAGGFLTFQRDFIKEIISVVIGVFLLIESIFRLQDALVSKKYNPNYKNSLILSLIGIACGALCVFGKIIIPHLMIQALGVMLIIFAFVDTTGGIMVNRSAKTINAKVIDQQ